MAHEQGPFLRPAALTQITAGGEPSTRAAAKLFLRVDESEEDSVIDDMLKTATRIVEHDAKIAILTQTWRLTFNAGSIDRKPLPPIIKIPRPPLATVDSVEAFDDLDVKTTVDVGDYIVDAVTRPGRIALKTGKSWPSALRPIDSFRVNFTAGKAVASIDPDIIDVWKKVVAFLYENRATPGIKVPPDIMWAIQPQKVMML